MRKICVVGLGYVGLPLAVAFGKKNSVTGFDINKKKIDELNQGHDFMGEVSDKDLALADINYTTDKSLIKKCDFIIIAVPTPIDKHNKPDLSPLIKASETVGRNLSRESIVVYESTVYPGVTEEVCVPILERESGLKCGTDFSVGYSPERINPGDKEHTIDKITKVVSGMDDKTLDIVADVYLSIIPAGVYRASSIKVAEAAKVIENIQRDLNIALMNELAMIFGRMGIKTKDVIEAASTKWNFHHYTPGLVGGHCIGVDPYYLLYKSEELGYHPEIITAGRRVNDNMHRHVAEMVLKDLIAKGVPVKGSKVLILGLTFKEDVSDFRNSRTKYLISEIRNYEVDVIAHDPHISDSDALSEFDIVNTSFKDLPITPVVVLAAPHKKFFSQKYSDYFRKLARDGAYVIDIKGAVSDGDRKEGLIYQSL